MSKVIFGMPIWQWVLYLAFSYLFLLWLDIGINKSEEWQTSPKNPAYVCEQNGGFPIYGWGYSRCEFLERIEE